MLSPLPIQLSPAVMAGEVWTAATMVQSAYGAWVLIWSMWSDAELTDEFTVLEDDGDLQPAENIVPVIRAEALTRWGEAEVTAALDGVSLGLTTPALRELNRRAASGEVAAVAARWLASD